jgi:hypothetical protein
MTTGDLESTLQQALLTARRVVGDRLMLADATLLAALSGARTLTSGERAALAASPLTMRRFRTLALEQRHHAWGGSAGMLRAADDGQDLTALVTDDGCWTLHFIRDDLAWRVILALQAGAPFASELVRGQPLLRVVDGAGALVLQGRLDSDGECEAAWPFGADPAPHFQQSGARFAVEPVPS